MRESRFSCAGAERRGAVLVLFVLLIFAFLAVAAIAIDMGSAYLTQADMQTAVDTGAIEGCRLRNFDEYPGISDSSKRDKVTMLIRQVFDDNLTPTGTDHEADALNLGAGTKVRVSGGTGTEDASATLDDWGGNTAQKIDDPILAKNLANQQWGDQVDGTFQIGMSSAEDADYERSDFVTATTVPDRVGALSFLVRMRRDGGTKPHDGITDVSTWMPTLPFMFGMGSTMERSESHPGWNPRVDGLTVRATAIAGGRPALRVGPPVRGATGAPLPDQSAAHNPILGTFPFAIEKGAWTQYFVSGSSSGSWHSAKTLTISVPTGTTTHLLNYLPPGGTGAIPVGRYVLGPDSVGKTLVTATTAPLMPPDQIALGGYVPIYKTFGTANGGLADRIVGYGFANVSQTVSAGDPTQVIRINVLPGFDGTYGTFNCWIAQDNASAQVDATMVALSAMEWQDVLAQTMDLAYPDPGHAITYDRAHVRNGTLLAPALTR